MTDGPRIMVFGTPVLMMCLARPFPQEVSQKHPVAGTLSVIVAW